MNNVSTDSAPGRRSQGAPFLAPSVLVRMSAACETWLNAFPHGHPFQRNSASILDALEAMFLGQGNILIQMHESAPQGDLQDDPQEFLDVLEDRLLPALRGMDVPLADHLAFVQTLRDALLQSLAPSAHSPTSLGAAVLRISDALTLRLAQHQHQHQHQRAACKTTAVEPAHASEPHPAFGQSESTTDARMRERILATLGHDLRTPLGAARMNADLLLLYDNASNEDVQAGARRITRCLGRADRMMRDLHDACRLRLGMPMPIFKEPCDLAHILRLSIDELDERLRQRIALEAPAELSVSGDADVLRRLFDHLICNAFRHGDPSAPVAVRLVHDIPARKVQFVVRNAGAPIPHPLRANLFEPFANLKPTSNLELQGWCIGLSLVRAMARAHGGTVSFESDPAAGTVFQVDLSEH